MRTVNENINQGFDGIPIPQIKDLGGDKAPLPQSLPNLEKSIGDLTFTPIIGTEASVIGRESTVTWQEMSKQMQQTRRSIEDKREREYFSSFMRERNISDVDSIVTQDVIPELLINLRREIVRLSYNANVVFADFMKCSAVCNLTTYGIRISDQRCIAELNEYLIRTCLAAAALEQSKVKKSELDVIRIYDRLLDLTYKFMGGEIPSINEEPFSTLAHSGVPTSHLDKVHRDLGYRDITKNYRHQLFIYQLEWLSDLIFYSFSLSGQFYPTIDELSFNAALYISEGDRRPASVYVFEKGGKTLVDAITMWYTVNDKGRSSEMKDFYNAIAHILDRQYKFYLDNEDKPKPVAFSLNFDLELERALQNIAVFRYYVAIPVLVMTPPQRKKNDVEQQIYLRWLLAKFEKDNKYIPTWSWFNEKTMFGRFEDGIDGPVVVKLHGSPLYRHYLPKPLSQEEFEQKRKVGKDPAIQYIASPLFGSVYYRIDPFIILSESDYLNNIVVIRNTPPIFENIFREKSDKRAFYFLGLSTSEWNMRLRIFDLLFPGNPKRDYIANREMVAINRDFDEYRSSTLNSLGVKRWYGSLEGLTVHLSRILRDSNSREVN